jgi:hypothetical protein
MHQWNKKGQNEEKWKKHVLQFEKTLYFNNFLKKNCSFGFAFQRWFVKLEKVLL